MTMTIDEATWGTVRLAAQAQRLWRLRVAAGAVRCYGLATRRQRLLVLKHCSVAEAGLLMLRTR